MKTLSLRLRGAKTELEEAGEDVEGMAENTSELQAKLKALTHGKVDIMLDANTFKSTTQILREMSAAWEDMNDIERASALELMGGKRQSNILSSVITNFETVEDVIETSMNSSGSAIAENEKWLDSIEGKTYKFTNALQTMWSNLINSEMVKGFLDFGTDAIQLLDTGAGKVLALVAAFKLMAKFKGFSLGGIAKGLKDTIQNITKAQQTLQALSSVSPITGALPTESINAYAQAVAGLTAKQQANLLASQNLTRQDIQSVLQTNKCTEAEIREAMAHVRTKATKDQEAASSQQLIAAKTQEAIASYKSQAAKLMEAGATETDIAVSEANAAASFLEANATNGVTLAKVKEAVSSGQITAATGAEIIAKLGLTTTNKGLLASIQALYASNPVGWIIGIISGVVMLIQWLGSLKKSAEDTAKELSRAAQEIKDAYNSESGTIQDNVKTLQGLQEEFDELSRGVDDYGNNISLATDDYKRYKEIVETIVGISPDLISGYDAEGNAIASKNGLLERSIALMEEEQRLKAKEFVSNENVDTLIGSARAEYSTSYDKLSGNFGTLGAALIDDNGNKKHGYVTQADDYISRVIGVKFNNDGINKYIVDNIGLIEENLDQILQTASQDYTDDKGRTWAGMTSHQLEIFKDMLLGYIDTCKNYSSEINSLLLLSAQADTAYYDLDAQMQGYLSNYISSLNTVDVDSVEAFNNMKKRIVDFTKFLANNSDVQQFMSIGVNLKVGKDENGKTLSYEDYKLNIDKLVDEINNSDYSNEQKTSIFDLIGLDADSKEFNNEIETAVVHAKNLLKDEFDENINSLSISDIIVTTKITEDPNSLTFDELIKKIEDARNVYDKSIFDLSKYQEKIEGINDSLDNIQGAYHTLSDAVKEYNSTGYLTLDTLQALLELNPEYLAMLQMENGQLSINKDAAIQLVKAKLAEAEAVTIDTAIQRLNALATQTAADATLDSGEAAATAASTLGVYAGQISSAGQEALVAAGKISALNAAIEGAQANQYVSEDDINRIIGDMNEQLTMIDKLRGNLNTNFTSIMKDKSSSSDSSDKDFDFIDVYFTNIENEISKRTAQLETLLDDASQIDIKHKLSDEIIDYYRQQAASAEKAAGYYSDEAANILSKIPAKYQNAIQNGTLDVASISDDSLRDLLTKYRDYVEKAASYTEKYWDSLEEVATKAKEKFDDTQSDYENKLSFNDIFAEQIQNEIDKAEEAGETVSKSYYESLIESSKDKLELLKQEQAALLEILQSGDVKEGTDEYYQMVAALNDIDSAIDECEQETIGWVNAMNEIDAEQFDKLLTKVDRLNEEIQNMYDLFENNDNLVDDTGNWTKDGVTALALLVQQMENAQYAADEVGKEIAALKPDDFSSYELYEERLNDLKDTQWDYVQQAEDARKSIVDLNKTRIDAVKDGMEKELEAYKELVEAKREALDADKDLYEFEKTMAEHSKNISEIERKLAALNNDNSMEAEAKRRRLQAELAEAKAEQQESLRDKNYNDVSKAYDDEETAAEESHKQMMESLESYLDDTERIINESLMTVLANADIVLENLNTTASEHGITLSSNLTDPWTNAAGEANGFKQIVENNLGGLVGEDGAITIFGNESEGYLTSPFISGEQASAKFKETVTGHLNGIKDELKLAYEEAKTQNESIIAECNESINAYKKVREEASKPTDTITDADGGLDSGGSKIDNSGGPSNKKKPSSEVKALQKYLNTYFNAGLEEDGLYGSATKSAVKNMQRKIGGVSADGWYGAKTVNALQDYWDKLIKDVKNQGSGSSILGQGLSEYMKGKKAIPAAMYGKGTMGASKDHWAITDEPWLGEELVLIPGPNGNLQYMRKGTSVIPADITDRLMDLALDPMPMIDRNRPAIGAPRIINNNFEINMSIAEVVHIDKVTNDTIPDLTKAIDMQMEKYMIKVNNSLKRYSRG